MTLRIALLLLAALAGAPAQASQSEFCTGFAEGYRLVAGGNALVPLCPLEPLTPLGSTPFREGLREGMRAARGR